MQQKFKMSKANRKKRHNNEEMIKTTKKVWEELGQVREGFLLDSILGPEAQMFLGLKSCCWCGFNDCSSFGCDWVGFRTLRSFLRLKLLSLIEQEKGYLFHSPFTSDPLKSEKVSSMQIHQHVQLWLGSRLLANHFSRTILVS